MFKKNITSIIMVSVLSLSFLSGCSLSEEEPEDKIEIVETEEGIKYEVETVKRCDVALTDTLKSKYTQTKAINYSFPVSNRVIKHVYVQKGDNVIAGQLLAELDTGSLEDDIFNLECDLESLNLKYQQTLESKQFELDNAETMFQYTSMTTDDRKKLEEDRQDIEEQYTASIDTLSDEILLTGKRLDECRKKFNDSYLYAELNGTISNMENNLEGTSCKADKVVMTIVDNSEFAFISKDIELAGYFKEGEVYQLSCGLLSNPVMYEVTPSHMDQWETSLYFSLVTPEADIASGANGRISIKLDEHKDTLFVSKNAVKVAGDDYYVYMLDENNVRILQYFTPGLISEDGYEIIDGLKEGDLIIIR